MRTPPEGSGGKLSTILDQSKPIQVVIDASDVSYCDGAGVAFFVKLQQYQAAIGGR